MEKINIAGGARVGFLYTSPPFATLTASQDKLEINASMIGRYTFTPEDIISIEPNYLIFWEHGIKINHKVQNYNKKIIFWAWEDSNYIIQKIKQTGFLNISNEKIERKHEAGIINEKQNKGGFPIKKPFVIGIATVWNLLFLIDFLTFINNPSVKIPFGKAMIIGLGILFVSCLLLLMSEKIRNIVLKKGFELKQISGYLYFLLLISGILLISFIKLIYFSHF